ncbi:MAG: O-methyltransferase [Lachnospiraceae bacterium]|nr:O-methyltransferase [Lachnospiraceae bacterium]
MEGISFERISSFVKSYISDDEGLLGQIYSEAIRDRVPVMRPETREFLKTQLIMKKPMQLLEIGTAVGYSSIYMSQFLGEGGKITTIELDEERVKIARTNIEAMDLSQVISVIQGDAYEVLKTLPDDTYDFAFVDAAKGQYINYYPDVMRVVKAGGIIISDNILQDGDVLESHFTVDKRNRTIHDRMREYIYTITHDERLDTAILSVGDGVAISVKK